MKLQNTMFFIKPVLYREDLPGRNTEIQPLYSGYSVKVYC